jgi:cytochrome c peroxidase
MRTDRAPRRPRRRSPEPDRRAARFLALALAVAALAVTGCDRHSPDVAGPEAAFTVADPGLVETVRALAATRGIGPLPPPPAVRPALARLGQALAFDPILSGNRNISCMTCHLPAHATGDGKSLSVGEGGSALGPGRTHPAGVFIPRNAPALFNLHALDNLFWDGRVSVDATGLLHTPADASIGAGMRRTFEFGAISGLGMFPVTNRQEMRGAPGTNELADIDDADFRGIWRSLMHRLGEIPEYRTLFEDAYPGTPFREMTFAHASNALAGFFLDRFHFAGSPWDRFLAGDDAALEPIQLRGARNFLSARCSICHGGPAFTDNAFHNVALAQFGPGAGDGTAGNDDFGRERVTGEPRDRYAFRSTPLRNVALTGPWGHAGQFTDLEEFVDHYSESDLKLFGYDVDQLEPVLRTTLVDNFHGVLATRDPLLDGVVFPREIIHQVTEYLLALTDPAALDLRAVIPDRVPSGLPIDR